MSSFQTATYSSLMTGNYVMNTFALRSIGYVHVLTGLVTIAIGVLSGTFFLYMGALCVGIWTGNSFLICGIISIMAGKSGNILTVLLMACTHVITLNFASTGMIITFSSLFPGRTFYPPGDSQGDNSDGVVHNQVTGTVLGIVHLVVSFIGIAVCLAGLKITWRILTSSINADSYRDRTQSYDEPYITGNSLQVPASQETRSRENPTPPPTYDAATHSLSTSPKTVTNSGSRAARYGSMSDSQTDGAVVS